MTTRPVLSSFPDLNDPFQEHPADHSGLSFAYGPGRVRDDNTVTDVAGGTVTLTDDDTNYVEVTGAGVVSKNTTGFTSGSIPLYTVVAASSAITTVTDARTFLQVPGAGGGGSSPLYTPVRRTAGDLSITSTTAGAAVPSLGTAIIAAAAGDLLMIGLDARESGSPPAQSMRLDVASIVSSSPVNYVSSLDGSPASTGIAGWFAPASTAATMSGVRDYVVQAGDISGGNIELSLRAWLSSAGTRTISATDAGPLNFWVRNLGQ